MSTNLLTKEELFKAFLFESQNMIKSCINHTTTMFLKPETVTIMATVSFVYRNEFRFINEYTRYHEGKLCAVTDKTGSTKFVIIPLSA